MSEAGKSSWFQDFIQDKIKSVKPQLLENLEKGKDSITWYCINLWKIRSQGGLGSSKTNHWSHPALSVFSTIAESLEGRFYKSENDDMLWLNLQFSCWSSIGKSTLKWQFNSTRRVTNYWWNPNLKPRIIDQFHTILHSRI